MNRHYFLKHLNGKQVGFKIFNTLIIWKMYIKTMMIDHLAPGRMAVMKKMRNTLGRMWNQENFYTMLV